MTKRLERLAQRLDESLNDMRKHVQARPIVDSVLRYFEGFERAARLRNHRSEYQHFEECWRAVHEAFYGEYRVPPRFIEPKPIVKESPAITPADRPAWFKEKYSHPMRRVTDMKIKKGRTFLVLICGHEVEHLGPDTRKHVRCRKCKAKLFKGNTQ